MDPVFSLVSRLYRRGFGRENIVRIHRFLEWVLKLPRDLEIALRDRIETELEGKKPMAYLMTIEREAMQRGEQKGLEKGLEKGLQKGLEEGLEEGLRAGIRVCLKLRFGDPGLALLPAIDRVQGNDRLRSLLDALERVDGIEEFRGLIEP